MSLFAPSSDVITGQLAIAFWFVAFAAGILFFTRYFPERIGSVFKHVVSVGLVAGLLIAYFLSSSGYLLKFLVMLGMAICMGIFGLMYGQRKVAWFCLLMAVLAYPFVAFQYVLVEMAR
ncbi:hypothetical protein [Xanthomonas cannabis]|uniref:Uncharacterized protein YacL n=1 Tax=Xanthomonas cannabis TaxID=1885674 RepID=A0ABR6JPA4_9XANT|nr:hypothetical protein [Xanthomonas cannabis]MBB4594641.1 uncharacterized protein YacL [Xanthomonas cannabis]MBB5523426.1 uncharacterized protein YacL [Xanthomonas cannabis]